MWSRATALSVQPKNVQLADPCLGPHEGGPKDAVANVSRTWMTSPIFPSLTLSCNFCSYLAEVTSPPFEVTEMGWGEFEAKMTMHFKDPQEKPVDILHQLRLYHDAAAGTTQPKKARPNI